MSNLGPYQEITAAAKAAGGVDLLIKSLEKGAVQKAAPSLLATGLGVGVTLGVKRWVIQRKADLAVAEEAKKQLVSEIEDLEGAAGSDSSQPDGDIGLA
ncbi:hypothetical protein ACWIDS_14295 [Dietzia maris]